MLLIPCKLTAWICIGNWVAQSSWLEPAGETTWSLIETWDTRPNGVWAPWRIFPDAHGSYYIGYCDTWSSQNLVPSLSVGNAGRLNPWNCTYFDRLQAAVILLKGLLSKYVKLIILKIVALNKRTRGPDLPWYCLNCTKFDKLILRKIISIVATCRRHILQLKCTKFDFEWGSALDHAGGAYSSPHTPLAGYKGAYF